MPQIEAPAKIRLAQGQNIILTLHDSVELRECRIIQNNIVLPETITLYPNAPFLFSPEAPGQYVVRSKDCEAQIEVVSDVSIRGGPVREENIWFPSSWAASIHDGYESAAMSLLPRLVQPDSVVYDIGANIGLYATKFLTHLGAQGVIYCFEPNPLALHYLSHNLRAATGQNYLILPIAIAEKESEVDLVLNPDNDLLGSMIFEKSGIRISVKALSLDETVSRFDLRPPNLIKMDIEGGEVLAIKGMTETLKRHQPILIFELHGQAAARETLGHLENYRWQIPGDDRVYSSAELSEVFPEACVQVVGRAGDWRRQDAREP